MRLIFIVCLSMSGCVDVTAKPVEPSPNGPSQTQRSPERPPESAGEWMPREKAVPFKPAFEMTRYGVESVLSNPILLGFPAAEFEIATVEDWLVPGMEPCINIIRYEVETIDAEGPVDVSIEEGRLLVAPRAVGSGTVVVEAVQTSVEPWQEAWEMTDECVDVSYPERYRFSLQYHVVQPTSATFQFAECDAPFRVSQGVPFFVGMRIFADDWDVSNAFNWPGLTSLRVEATSTARATYVSPEGTVLRVGGSSPGRLKLESEFGDVTEIVVTDETAVSSIDATAVWGLKSEMPADDVPIGAAVRFKVDATFDEPHCLQQATPVVTSRTNEICASVDDNQLEVISSGVCEALVTVGSHRSVLEITTR